MPPPKRFPFLMWGDLVEGREPVLRRALAGYRAHECMYAWVYLTEYLAHRRLLERLPDLTADMRRGLFQGMDETVWEELDRAKVDPHFQITRPMFESIAAMTFLAADAGEARPVFVELGSTFFTSRLRFEIVDRVARERFADWPKLEPHWLGIDNSPFMHDTTHALHGEGIELADDYRSASKSQRFSIFLSRFVASYAFQSGTEFADYLGDRFQAALVEDAYSTTEHDLNVFNHGQAETFFAIPATLAALEKHGMEVWILNAYPDHPAGAAPCHVIRYMAAKKGLVSERFRERMREMGFEVGAPVAAQSMLPTLNDSVSPARWAAVRKAKEESPVWGRTPDETGSPVWNSIIRRGKDWVRRYFLHPAWRRYRFSGPLAEREIIRALREEKP